MPLEIYSYVYKYYENVRETFHNSGSLLCRITKKANDGEEKKHSRAIRHVLICQLDTSGEILRKVDTIIIMINHWPFQTSFPFLSSEITTKTVNCPNVTRIVPYYVTVNSGNEKPMVTPKSGADGQCPKSCMDKARKPKPSNKGDLAVFVIFACIH